MAIDESGFIALLLRQLDEAHRVAAWILGDVVAAEDAVQESAARAWSARESPRDPATISAWFGRIVVNTCRDELRRRGRRPALADLTLADPLPDPAVRDRTDEGGPWFVIQSGWVTQDSTTMQARLMRGDDHGKSWTHVGPVMPSP